MNAFSASAKSTGSISSCWNKLYVHCVDGGLLYPYLGPHTPIGRIPGFFFRGIKRFAMNASRVSPTSLIDVFKEIFGAECSGERFSEIQERRSK